MCKRFTENRNALNKMILEKKEFERKQLEADFFDERKGDIFIDGSHTIRDYLDELAESGFLRDCGRGHYRLVKT